MQDEIDPFPTSTIITKCDKCNAGLRVIRTVKDIKIKLIQAGQALPQKPLVIDEEMIGRVKNELPQQPWPKGISKVVATKLNLSTTIVHLIIQELIKRGIFNQQIDGKVYVPLK
jgi:ribosomal protein S25